MCRPPCRGRTSRATVRTTRAVLGARHEQRGGRLPQCTLRHHSASCLATLPLTHLLPEWRVSLGTNCVAHEGRLRRGSSGRSEPAFRAQPLYTLRRGNARVACSLLEFACGWSFPVETDVAGKLRCRWRFRLTLRFIARLMSFHTLDSVLRPLRQSARARECAVWRLT